MIKRYAPKMSLRRAEELRVQAFALMTEAETLGLTKDAESQRKRLQKLDQIIASLTNTDPLIVKAKSDGPTNGQVW